MKWKTGCPNHPDTFEPGYLATKGWICLKCGNTLTTLTGTTVTE